MNDILTCGHVAKLVNDECPVCDRLLCKVDNTEWALYQLRLAFDGLTEAQDFAFDIQDASKKAIHTVLVEIGRAIVIVENNVQELQQNVKKYQPV